MFGEQLNFVSGESAWLLGECASREIVAHLWTKGIIAAAAAVQDNEIESLVGQLVSAVSQIEGEDESGVLKERNVKEKVSNYVSKAKIVSGPAWEKLNGGAGWIKFSTEIPTSTGDKWTADGVFHRAGIVVEKGDGNVSFSISFLFSLCCCLLTLMSFSLFCFVVCFVDLIDKKFWFSGEPTKPEKYGCRKGSEEEARDGKLDYEPSCVCCG